MPEQDRTDLAVIGRPLVKVDAAAKVTGQTVFADDLVLPGLPEDGVADEGQQDDDLDGGHGMYSFLGRF